MSKTLVLRIALLLLPVVSLLDALCWVFLGHRALVVELEGDSFGSLGWRVYVLHMLSLISAYFFWVVQEHNS